MAGRLDDVAMHDGMHEDVTAAFPSFFEALREARAHDPQGKTLVHCEAGVSRSATLVVAGLMERSQGRFYETFCEVRAKRAEVLVNVGFATQLQRLERRWHPAPEAGAPSSLAKYLRQVCAAPVDVAILEEVLQRYDHDAVRTLETIFGGEIPRVVQGVRR